MTKKPPRINTDVLDDDVDSIDRHMRRLFALKLSAHHSADPVDHLKKRMRALSDLSCAVCDAHGRAWDMLTPAQQKACAEEEGAT